MDLTINFIDLYNDARDIQLNRIDLLQMCAKRKIDFFNEYLGTSSDNFTIFVPFASAMVDVIGYLLTGEMNDAPSSRVIERVICMNFIGVDFTNEFYKLFDLVIDTDTYRLIHQFIAGKCYNKMAFIRLLALKLPYDYDRKELPDQVLKQITRLSAENLFVTHSIHTVSIYDIETRQVLNTFAFKSANGLESIKWICVNKVKPYIVVRYTTKCILYNILTGRIITGISGWRGQLKVTSVCFAPTGSTMYVSSHGAIEAFDLERLELISRYEHKGNASAMQCAPKGDVIAFVDTTIPVTAKNVCLLDLITEVKIDVDCTSIAELHFVDAQTLLFNSYYNDYLCTYNYETTKIDQFKHYCGYNLRRGSIYVNAERKIICHPRTNMFVASFLNRSNDKGYNTVIFSGSTYVTNSLIGEPNAIDAYHCFSHDGKRIYTLSYKTNCCQIFMHTFDTDGRIEFKCTLPTDQSIFSGQLSITNVVYNSFAIN